MRRTVDKYFSAVHTQSCTSWRSCVVSNYSSLLRCVAVDLWRVDPGSELSALLEVTCNATPSKRTSCTCTQSWFIKGPHAANAPVERTQRQCKSQYKVYVNSPAQNIHRFLYEFDERHLTLTLSMAGCLKPCYSLRPQPSSWKITERVRMMHSSPCPSSTGMLKQSSVNVGGSSRAVAQSHSASSEMTSLCVNTKNIPKMSTLKSIKWVYPICICTRCRQI